MPRRRVPRSTIKRKFLTVKLKYIKPFQYSWAAGNVFLTLERDRDLFCFDAIHRSVPCILNRVEIGKSRRRFEIRNCLDPAITLSPAS